ARRGRSGARAGGVDQDGPVRGEEWGDVVGLVVVGGIEVAGGGEAVAGVGGEEQRAAGGDRVEQAAQRGVAGAAAEREVVEGHQVEAGGRGRGDGEVGLLPGHAGPEARVGCCGGASQGGGG